jgi:hypothetical protein
MKSFLFALFILISFDLFAQTITPIPIYKGSQSLTIDILQSGRIWFGFQNPDYQTIVDIKSFTVNSKDKAIELIDKAIYILAMNKTDRDQNIRDEYENVVCNGWLRGKVRSNLQYHSDKNQMTILRTLSK